MSGTPSAATPMSAHLDRRQTLVVAFAALLLISATPAAQAQRLSDLPAGTRLRVRTDTDPQWHDGSFAGARSDSLAFQNYGEIFVVPRTRIQSLEWRQPDASRWKHAGVGGLVGGAILAGAVAIANVDNDRECHDPQYRVQHVCAWDAAFTAIGGGLGFLVGAGVGALWPVERWRAVEQPIP